MFIGIDPSLTNTAVCSGPAAGPYAIKTFGSRPLGTDVRGRLARYEDLVARIADYLETLGPIELVAMEGYSMGSRQGREEAGEYGGLLRWHLLDLGPFPIVEVSPSSLKKFCTGTGNHPKGQAKEMVIAHLTKRYGVLLNSNDEYDAFGLWRLGLCLAGHVEPATAAQGEVLAKLISGPVKKPRKPRKLKEQDTSPQLSGQDEPLPF